MTCVATGSAYVVPAVVGLRLQAGPHPPPALGPSGVDGAGHRAASRRAAAHELSLRSLAGPGPRVGPEAAPPGR
jgi:hypothetical protein